MYQGEPVLAVAAVDELTAAEAIEQIEIDWEPLPFNVDPLDSLRPGRRTRASKATSGSGRRPTPGQPPPLLEIQEFKWTAQDFATRGGPAADGQATDEWSYGDVEAGFKNAALVLDETFVTPNTNHQTLESRSAMAYWQNGKLYIHCSTQSMIQTVMSVARWLHIEPTDIVLISNYTGGGFGSKATGTHHLDHPGAACRRRRNAPVHDAHQPRRRAFHRRRASGGSWPGEGRVSPRTAASPRSTCSSWRERSL